MNRILISSLLLSCAGFTADSTNPAPSGNRIVWHAPRQMTRADWVWGPGGQQHAPLPPFQFVTENFGGTNPKVNVHDGRGALWIVKFGGEVHTDVFASRLLYAVGYAAEPTYFVERGVIVGAKDLKRAKPFIAKDGQFRNARFKLRDDARQSYANEYKWTWTDNPFVGSHEMNGLR